MKRKPYIIFLIMFIFIFGWLVIAIVKTVQVKKKSEELQLQVQATSNQSEEENWYYDVYSERRLIEIFNEASNIRASVNILNAGRMNLLLEKLDIYVLNVRSDISSKTDVYNKLKSSPFYLKTEEYNEKIAEAQRWDILWEKGEMISWWENENETVTIISVPLRGFKLCDNALVPCTFEEMTKNMYAVADPNSKK